MQTAIKKITAIVSLCFLFCVGATFHMSAIDRMVIEGSFSPEDARSLVPPTPVEAFVDGNQISINFYQYLSSVTLTVKDSEGTVVYTKTSYAPESEVITLDNCPDGAYTLEMRNKNGYVHGAFVLSVGK